MNNLFKYRFTIFTPCYNSAKFIHRVMESLESQEFRDFEWLVINDASTDNTHELIEAYRAKASFSIQYFNLAKNQMLSNNFNLAFEKAQGGLFIIAGHDDRFHPEALQVFDEVWENYGNEKIAAIWSLCQDQHGKLVGNEFPEKLMVSNYFKIFMNHIYTMERFGCTRTEILRKYPFDTSKIQYISEGTLWGRIGLEYDTIYINTILRTYYIEQDNDSAMTKSGRKKYAGSSYHEHLCWVNQFNACVDWYFKQKLRHHFGMVFYGLLSGKSFSVIFSDTRPLLSKMINLAIYPVAAGIYLTMKITGKGL